MPKPDLILHIGHSKTGSSSIQTVLARRRDALLAAGVCYPESPGYANHGLLPACLVPVDRLGYFHPNVWEGLPPETRLERFRQDFAAELAAMGPEIRTLILSAEQCAGLLTTEEEITRLRDLLAPHVGEVRVVMYLRRQDSHYASNYTQMLRLAHLKRPAFPKEGPDRLPQYDYDHLLDVWARVFGDAAMCPRIFESASLLGGDVVDDFLDLCGIAMVVPKDDPDRQNNASIAPEGIALARAFGAHLDAAEPGGLTAASPLWRRFMAMVSDVLPGRGWRPTPDESRAFMARFSATNDAVRSRWFPDRPSLFSDHYGDAAPVDFDGIEAAAALDAGCSLLARSLSEAAQREAEMATSIGRLHQRLGEFDLARRSLRVALRAVPDHPPAHMLLGDLDLTAGDFGAAEAHLAALRDHHPEDAATQRLERRIRQTLRAAGKPIPPRLAARKQAGVA